MLQLVGITPTQAGRRPHEFSGGQRQRIGVARALILHPELVILDEPISALDVSIQAQVLNLLKSLQAQLELTYVFIVHDLVVAEYFCDRLAVLYRGAVAELADRETLFREPLHPYTVSLLSAVPIPDPASERRRERIVLHGELEPPSGEQHGCRFQSRCPVGHDRAVCADRDPPLVDHGSGHWAACHFPGELTAARPAAA
jgi:oligopeptide/dipeptide ABC transporter ATP-binding protein